MRKVILLVVSALCLSILQGCSESHKGQKDNAPKTIVKQTVRVGYLPSLAASPFYAAIAKGYFTEEGLEVKFQEIFSGPELVNALQGKAIDVAFSIVPSMILARSKGLPITSIVGATTDSKYVREHRIMLQVGSTIKTARDLKGKKIAVVAQGTSDHFGLLQYLKKNGLNESDVEIIKTPHPEMIFAIASKAVDAACGIEPFITIGKIQGKVEVFDYYYPDESIEIGTYLVHEDYLKANPNVVAKFVNAIRKANIFCRDQAQLRKLLPTLEHYGIKFRMTSEAANVVTIMEFRDSLSEAGVTRVMNDLIVHGMLKEPIDVKACIPRIGE